jgi:selenium metabolism protein YedF
VSFSFSEGVAKMKEIDCRGMACPLPVVTIKRAIEEGEKSFTVLVDNEAARENVRRFGESRQYSVAVSEEAPGKYRLNLTSISSPSLPEKNEPAVNKEKIVVYIAHQEMGAGNDELGLILMRAFLKTIPEFKPLPQRIIFLNSGVKLTTSGSPVLEILAELEKDGVEILSCGTCLDFFNLKAQLKAGKVTNMFEIIATLRSADRVIAP